MHVQDGSKEEAAVFRKIEAIIREEALDGVREALSAIGIVGMNVFEIRGHGRQGGQEDSWRYTFLHKDMLPKIQLNVILSERNVEPTVAAIMKAARTGQRGGRHHLHLPGGGRRPRQDRAAGKRRPGVSGRYRRAQEPRGGLRARATDLSPL